MNTIIALVEHLFDSSKPVRCEYCEHYNYCFRANSAETVHRCELEPEWSAKIKQEYLNTVLAELDCLMDSECKSVQVISEIKKLIEE